MNAPDIFSFALPTHPITKTRSEQVGHDNPMAQHVAGPLFDAGICFAAITERPEYVRNEVWPRPWHEFHLVIQGTLRLQTEEQSLTVHRGDLGFCPAGISYQRTGLPDMPVQFAYIRLLDTPAWHALGSNGLYARPYESADLLFLLLRRILDAHRYRRVDAIALAQTYARTLVDLMQHEIFVMGCPTQPYAAELHHLINEMHENPGADWNVRAMADRLHVSVRKLYRIFKAEYGMPPREMVIKQRMAYAAQELSRTPKSVGEIAASIGYTSLYSFSNLFKQQTGLSPTAHRHKFQRQLP